MGSGNRYRSIPGPTTNKNFLANPMSVSSDPFQRTDDINMKSLGPTTLEMCNCEFHKSQIKNKIDNGLKEQIKEAE
ncbi:MAG: hypothetical protein ACJ72V_13295 [Nitrososphaeraceae archaeon]